MVRYSILLIVFCCLVRGLTATEIPQVLHFHKDEYKAQNQNWSICQGPDYRMYFGNSSGLLCYDGSQWNAYPAPGNQIIRSTVCDSSGRVYVGGFATFGYWEVDSNLQFVYTSLADKVMADNPISEEIWHILPIEDGILFQSFSTFYKYDFETIQEIKPPGNIMFAQRVNGEVIVPVIQEGLFKFLADGTFDHIEGSNFLQDMRVGTIISSGPSSYLVCTQNDGIFEYRDGQFTLWETPINEGMKRFQLNKALPLENGDYAFGTILNGLFITDANGNIKYHINRENGLQNNTVLALYEDAAHNIWAGLDKGIDLIATNSPFVYYQDNQGEIGTVYTAAVWDNKLYVGTNQGIYYKTWPSRRDEHFQLIDGSQGQVWDLQVIDGQLLCGHNKGTFLLNDQQLKLISNVTGGYSLIRHPQRDDLLLQGTYTGVTVLKKNLLGEWAFSHRLPDFLKPARKILFDADGLLWIIHPHQGINSLQVDPNVERIIENKAWGIGTGLPTDFGPDITLLQGRVVIKSARQFFVHQQGKLLPAAEVLDIPLVPGDFKLVAGRGSEYFCVYPSRVVYHQNDQSQTFYFSMVYDHERIEQLPNSLYLFCLDSGYCILAEEKIQEEHDVYQPIPLITSIMVQEKRLRWTGKNNEALPVEIQSNENNLRFYFTLPNYERHVDLRYRLLGNSQNTGWSLYSDIDTKEFSNLPPGKYSFQVQAANVEEVASFSFVVLPRWYQTHLAKVLLLILVGLITWVLYRGHLYRLEQQKRQIIVQKERELQQQRIQNRNEMLQKEILGKSREIADSTMNLVRKNETLIKIKEDLQQLKSAREQSLQQKHINRLIHLVDNHLTSEEDWKVFEANFNQLHDQFFKRLKNQFPDLTPGDLRLAAYLKMNLSSKEIAPLLNISLRGVENKRYRLRRKMLLDPDINLTEYLMEY